MSEPRKLSTARAIILGGATTMVCLLPVFLTGAMAVQLTRDLAFGSAGLGLAVAVFRATGAVVSVPLGGLVDRLGVTRTIRLAAGISGLTSLGLATTVANWWMLALWMVVGGCAQALGRPGANRLLANHVDPKRLGIAFGLKNSSPPAAGMLAGLSVPLIVLTLGWQWAYFLSAILSLLVLLGAGRRPPKAQRRPAADRAKVKGKLENRRLIVTLAAAFGLGTFTSSVLSTFYVDAAVQAGTSEAVAGAVLAVASLAAIGSRITSGIVSDRLPSNHLRLCAGLLASGSLGILLLAVGPPSVMVVGVIVAAAGTWGFNGVFWYALIRAYPSTPGAITGALAPGALVGATLGPTIFGGLAESVSYSVAWGFSSFMGLVAATAMLYGNRKLIASGQLPQPDAGTA